MSMIKIEIIGNLAKDAGIESINGKNVVKFVVGVDEGKGENKTTRWIMCLCGNEKMQPYLVKGKQVFVEGTHRCSAKQGNEGKIYVNEYINVTNLQLLGKTETNNI